MTVDAQPSSPTDPESLALPTQVPPTVRRTRRRRRPSGAPPPLPRSIGFSGKAWLLASVVLVVWTIVALSSDWAMRLTNRADSAILRLIAEFRTGWLTDVADAIDRFGSGWTVTVIGISLIVALIVFKRWRHLFAFLGAVLALMIIGEILYFAFARPRPYDVSTLGRWAGYSFPAAPVAVLAFLLIGVTYSLVPHGRARSIAKFAGQAIVVVFLMSGLYLATYHPFDVAVGLCLTVALLLNGFRFFTPNEVFPVSYQGGKTAHLDVTGARGTAIRQAIEDQLGMNVLDVKPVGLAGSGGSTPLRIQVEGNPDTYLFGKLYAMSHVRADRWYKLGRTLLYGRLEDETPVQSVRQLVEYEDYALRLMRDSAIAVATPYGIVEITPSREYLLLTEFFDGAKEMGDAEVDDQVIDGGLLLIRQLWDCGLAHRDIKPANLLVKDGRVQLIDVAFMQLRPSPWRQAVDLANMMLVLAVRTDPERVYAHALRYFSEDEIAEAFAAARGVASPTQLRTAMKQDGRDLLARFRALAPERRPISLQRWSPIRVALALALVIGAAIVVPMTISLLTPAHDLGVSGSPTCRTNNLMVLMAQTVPSATVVPCIATVPAGWDLGDVEVERGRGRFTLDSDAVGSDAVEVTLLPRSRCNVQGATEVPTDEVGLQRFERVRQLPPELRSTRYYLFPGGCVRYEFAFDGRNTASLIFEADSALDFLPREHLVRAVQDEDDLKLCGAGAPCAGGA